MIEPVPKRLQIHLSTAIVLMFVAGGLIWLNTTRWTFRQAIDGEEVNYYGWPVPAWKIEPEVPRPRLHTISIICGNRRDPEFSLTFDVIFGILLLTSVWYICEWQIRRASREVNTVQSAP